MKQFWMFLSLSIFLSGTGNAQMADVQMDSAVGLTAPAYSDHTAVEAQANSGDIVFNALTNVFYGRTTSNTSGSKWVALSSPIGSNTIISGGTEKAERVVINPGASCSITSQSGSWVSSATANTAGDCTLQISGFASLPTCVGSVLEASTTADQYTLKFISISTTSIRFQVVARSAAGGSAAGLNGNSANIICMGPR